MRFNISTQNLDERLNIRDFNGNYKKKLNIKAELGSALKKQEEKQKRRLIEQ